MATSPSPSVAGLGHIFTDPAEYASPARWHELARQIRSEAPILRVKEDGFPAFWAITKHADVMEIERRPEVFTNAPICTLTQESKLEEASSVVIKTLVQMDGEEHKHNRGLVSDWFKPGGVTKVQGRVEELAHQSVDRMAAAGGHCDFINDVALHYPLHVILTILGLPEEDFPRMLKLTQEMFGAEDPDVARIGDNEAIVSVMLDFMNYFTDLANDRRAEPTADLASVIANGMLEGQPLPDTATLGHYLIIATAGHDTTSSAIAGGLLALLEYPDQLELLKSRPELIDRLADEIIRYVSPVKHFMRNCQETFTLRETTFQPGDSVYLSFASANRDEEVFPDPMRFDVLRENSASHLGFGFGRHFCLGVHLARMEVRALFKELIPRLESIELAGDPTWIQANFVQGPKTMPVSYKMT